MIELKRIRPDPSQPRKDAGIGLDDLVTSIRSLGVLQPISVRFSRDAGTYVIISGERRFQAASRAGLSEIPCWVQQPDDRQVLVRQVVENWQRADLAPMEIAESLKSLRDNWKYSQQEIADLIGKSKSEVSKFLQLLNLDDTIQEEVKSEGTGVSRKHLESVARLPADQQRDVFDQVTQQKLTAGETERIVRERLAKNNGTKVGGGPQSARSCATRRPKRR